MLEEKLVSLYEFKSELRMCVQEITFAEAILDMITFDEADG